MNLKSEGMADMQRARVRAAVKVQRQCAGWQLCLALGGNQSLFYEGSNDSGKVTHIMEGGLPNVSTTGPASWHIKLIIKIYLRGAEK